MRKEGDVSLWLWGVCMALVLGSPPLANAALPGYADPTFNTSNGPSLWQGGAATVWSMLPLRNGQVLVGGAFERVEGTNWAHLARLNHDGSLDRTFTARPSHPVRAILEQPDGRILIAGEFNAVNGQFRDRVARLEADGSLDTNFTVRLGLNGRVHSLALQFDGQVIAGGAFHVARDDAPWIHNVIRLQTNGAIDFTFDPGTQFRATNITVNYVRAVAVQPGFGLLVAGSFSKASGSQHDYLVRLLADGTVDSNFGSPWQAAVGGAVHALAIDGDGWITVGGSFTNVQGLGRTNIARLTPEGVVDEGSWYRTQTWSGNAPAEALAHDAGGRLYASFVSFDSGGMPNNGLVVRFDSAGNYDPQFPSLSVRRSNFGGAGIVALNPVTNGALLVAGNFGLIRDTPSSEAIRRCVAILDGDEPGMPVIRLAATNLVSDAGLDIALHASISISSPTFYQWFRGGAELPGETNPLLRLPDAMPSNSGDYQLVASNAFGVTTSVVATVTVREPVRAGAVDLSFAPTWGANSNVAALAQGPHQSLYVGGRFNRIEGRTLTGLVRLDSNGRLDSNFLPVLSGATPVTVEALEARPDHELLVGGYFFSVNGASTHTVAWLTGDGQLKTGFSAKVPPSASYPGARALAVDPHGRILVGGWFVSTLDTNQRFLIRLLPDGQHDLNFRFGNSLSLPLQAVEIDSSGRILAGGRAGSLFGRDLVRISDRAVVDSVFRLSGFRECPGGGTSLSDCGFVNGILVQPDDKLVIVGDFDEGLSAQGESGVLGHFTRLNPDGSFDRTFTRTNGANGPVMAVARQLDGKILLGGGFDRVNGVALNRLARLNPDGSVDATFDVGSGPNGSVNALLVLDDGRIAVGGNFTSFNGHRRGRVAILHGGVPSAPALLTALTNQTAVAGEDLVLSALVEGYPSPTIQWLRDGIVISDAKEPTLRLANLRASDSGTYSLVMSNASGMVTSVVATLTIGPSPLDPGVIDPTFFPGLGTDGDVLAMALQKDGRIVIGGNFTRINGIARAGIARLMADGTVDTEFDPGSGLSEMPSNNIYVGRIDLMPDGKIVVGGNFSRFNGVSRGRCVRLNPNGSLDESFPDVGGWPLLALNDGKLLLGGFGNVRRVTREGEPDGQFTISTNSDADPIQAAAVEADGKFVFAGRSLGLTRFHPDTSQDLSFSPPMTHPRGADACFFDSMGGSGGGGGAFEHRALLMQPDGKILLGGVFYMSSGRQNLNRLLPSGEADSEFSQFGGPSDAIRCVALQPDGKILAGGCFTNIIGNTNETRHHLARFNPDGTVDPDFSPRVGFLGTTDGWVNAIVRQPDGRILIAGRFSHVDGVARNNIARLGGEVWLFEPSFEGEAFSARVTTDEGRTYRLEWKASMEDEWETVVEFQGDGTIRGFQHSTGSDSRHFYRLRVE